MTPSLRTRRRCSALAAAALVTAALGAAALAGCAGGDASQGGTPAVTAAAQASGPPAPGADRAPAGVLASAHLPPEAAVPGVGRGPVRRLDDAREAVAALYAPGDPVGRAASRRLRDGGFAGGVLRDQAGRGRAEGPTLLRSYAFEMGSDATAAREARTLLDEARGETSLPVQEIPLDVPGVQAIRIDATPGGSRLRVLYVTFAAGRAVYGIQAFTVGDGAMPEGEVLGAAADLRARVAAGG